jgi:hypothetical protein
MQPYAGVNFISPVKDYEICYRVVCSFSYLPLLSNVLVYRYSNSEEWSSIEDSLEDISVCCAWARKWDGIFQLITLYAGSA